jgi:zinc/manganese transport system permease protein
LSSLSDFPLISPFIEFGFMRRALAGCLALSFGAAPVGVFLMLRRMSLAADAISHAILPGAAIGYLVAGLSFSTMTLGGLIAGIVVALLAGGVARNSVVCEDTSFAAFYLISISAGVLLISMRGSNVDLLHVLFGSVLALDDAALFLLAAFTSFSIAALSLGLRLVVFECCDPAYLSRISRLGPLAHYGFMALVVVNLVGGFHTLGALMAVGLMILPAASARFWVDSIAQLLIAAALLAFLASAGGLILSFHLGLPAGPAIVLTLGAAYLFSMIFGPRGPVFARFSPRWHFK